MYGLHHILRRLLCGLVFLFSVGSLNAVTLTNPVGSTFGTVDYANGQYTVSIGYNAVNPSGNSEHQLWSVKADGSRDVRFKFVALSRNGTYYGAAYTGTLAGADYPHGIIFVTRWGTGLPGAPFTETEVLLGGLQSQNITVTREAGQEQSMIGVPETWAVSGVASGASLIIHNASGANVIIYQGKVHVTPTGENFSFGIRAGATATHSASDVVNRSGVALPYERKWEFDIPTNHNNVAISWRVVQGTNVLGSGEIAPGFSGKISGTAPEPYPDPELQFASKYKYDLASERWVPVQSGEEQWTTVQISELSDLPASYSGSASVPKIGGQNSGSNSTIWSSVNSANENDLLTKGVYATGVSKTEDAIRSQAASIAQAGQTLDTAAGKIDAAAAKMNEAATAIGGAAASFADLGSKMDRVAEAAEGVEGHTEEMRNLLAEEGIYHEVAEQERGFWNWVFGDGALTPEFAAKLTTRGQSERTQADGQLSAAETQARGLLPALPSAPAPLTPESPSAPEFKVAMPAKFGGKTFDLNPFRADRLGPLVDWFRGAMAWLVLALWGYWVSGEVKDWVRGFSTLQQAKGNAVAGGTGGQATTLLNAGIITVAFSVFVAGLVGYLTGDFAITSVLSAVASGAGGVVSSLGSVLPGALWMLEKVFPVYMICTVLLLKITWRFWGAQVFAIAAAAVRFAIG